VVSAVNRGYNGAMVVCGQAGCFAETLVEGGKTKSGKFEDGMLMYAIEQMMGYEHIPVPTGTVSDDGASSPTPSSPTADPSKVHPTALLIAFAVNRSFNGLATKEHLPNRRTVVETHPFSHPRPRPRRLHFCPSRRLWCEKVSWWTCLQWLRQVQTLFR